MNVRHRWHPVVIEGRTHWHHWIITEYPIKRGIGSEVRVAYETLNADSEQVPTSFDVWTRAIYTAEWVLCHSEVMAFRNLEKPV